MSRILLVRVTVKDCVVQTFRAGGKGGQNQNKRDTGVRVIHPPSGAVGESREERSQLQNKKLAFRRMAEHPRFRRWLSTLDPQAPHPPAANPERIRTYNMVDRYVKDHRSGKSTTDVCGVLDGALDQLR